jgi:hypothetical protein
MSGTNFFKNFPKRAYRFGDNELPVTYQDLSAYIDIFDQVREEKTYYQSYYVKNRQRPDQLSYELYGTVDYHWTFFLVNEKLRLHGWPLPTSEVYSKSKHYYPRSVLSTNGTSYVPGYPLTPLSLSENFVNGSCVYLPLSKVAGKILKVDHNLASITLEVGSGLVESSGDIMYCISKEDEKLFLADPSYVPGAIETTTIEKAYDGWDAIHHYENSSGDWVWPSQESEYPYQFNWNTVSTVQSISHYQRLRELNDDVRSIAVLRPETVPSIVSEFNALLTLRS